MATLRNFGFVVLAAAALSGCASTDNVSYSSDNSEQPYPPNYRTEILAFLRTYLNEPRGVKEAAIAEPVQRKIAGRMRYVACLRYNARETDGSYRGAKERGVLFIDGRLDRIIEKPEDACAGSTYAPFPELEKLTR
ncbi:MAG: hypothetical protein J0I29_07785 [Rhizobiales bacterium]|nr:hypothetical protein [Hyphomicrobiales bacterium]